MFIWNVLILVSYAHGNVQTVLAVQGFDVQVKVVPGKSKFLKEKSRNDRMVILEQNGGVLGNLSGFMHIELIVRFITFSLSSRNWFYSHLPVASCESGNSPAGVSFSPEAQVYAISDTSLLHSSSLTQ